MMSAPFKIHSTFINSLPANDTGVISIFSTRPDPQCFSLGLLIDEPKKTLQTTPESRRFSSAHLHQMKVICILDSIVISNSAQKKESPQSNQILQEPAAAHYIFRGLNYHTTPKGRCFSPPPSVGNWAEESEQKNQFPAHVFQLFNGFGLVRNRSA